MEDFRAKRKKNSEILTEVLGGFYFKITLSFGKKNQSLTRVILFIPVISLEFCFD